MAIAEIISTFTTSPLFIGGIVVVVLAIVGGGLWWLYKEGKLPF